MGLMVILMLRLLLWPLKQLNKGLHLSGKWMLNQWVTL